MPVPCRRPLGRKAPSLAFPPAGGSGLQGGDVPLPKLLGEPVRRLARLLVIDDLLLQLRREDDEPVATERPHLDRAALTLEGEERARCAPREISAAQIGTPLVP